MISFFARHKKTIYPITIGGFLVATFVGLGSYFYSASNAGAPVAQVGGEKIPYDKFIMQVNRVLENMREQGVEVTDAMQKQVKQEMLRKMIVESVFYQQALKYGVDVSDLEVAAEVQNTPAFLKDGVFHPIIYAETLRRNFAMTPEQYESWRKDSRTAVRFQQFIAEAAKVTPREVDQAYAKGKKGGVKDAEKEKEKLLQSMTQERAFNLVNNYLRQTANQTEIKTFLDQREKGI